MDIRKTFERTARRVDAGRERLLGTTDATRAAWVDLEVDEALGSLALAGSPLGRSEVEILARRGVPDGGHPLEAYVIAADYLEALRFIRSAPLPNRRRRYLSIEEIVALHARIVRRSSERAGEFRTTSLRPLRAGIVAPPPWLVPRALAAYVERVQFGPGRATPLLWVADAHARFERIQPFDVANGRVGRALVSLLLRRLGFLPFVVRPRDAERFRAALRSADSRDPWPLALSLAQSLLRSYVRVEAALAGAAELRPLSELASGRNRVALYKAAQRGRLKSFRRGGRLLTTAAWVAEYHAS